MPDESGKKPASKRMHVPYFLADGLRARFRPTDSKG
jgi:hypothetical protein